MRYTFVKQHEATDCAAACMAMVCLHYKKETTITRLRDMMGTDLKGTNLIGLSKCAEELGFMSQAVRVDREGFLSEYTLPAIANIVTKEGLSHFIVVFKITNLIIKVGASSFVMNCISACLSWLGYKGTTAALLAIGTTIATSIELGTAGMGTLIAGAFILAMYTFVPKLVSLAIAYGCSKVYGQQAVISCSFLKKDFTIAI